MTRRAMRMQRCLSLRLCEKCVNPMKGVETVHGEVVENIGANGGSRTPMSVSPLEPKSSASASSATFALLVQELRDLSLPV